MSTIDHSDFKQTDEASERTGKQAGGPVTSFFCQQCGNDVTQLAQTAVVCPRCQTTLDWPAIRRNVEAVDAGRVKSASTWTMLNYGIRPVISLANQSVVTWLLFREAFGLMSLVIVFMTGIHLLTEMGSHQIIIQSKREDRAFLDTVWTFQVVRGFVLWFIAIALAYPAALWFDKEMLVWLLPVACVNAAIIGLESTKEDVMYRRLTIGRVTALDLASFIISIVVTLGLAGVWCSVWVLVIGQVVGASVRMVATHVVLPGPMNRLHWDRSVARELGSFGRWIFISTGVGFLAGYVDRLLLGRFLSEAFLGIYDRALIPVAMPINVIGGLAQAVLFPVLSQQTRVGREELTQTFHASRDLVLGAAKVYILGMVLFSPAFFGFFFPPTYVDAIWIAQTLSVFVWISLLRIASDRALLAEGDTWSLMFSNVWKFAVTTVACLAGYYISRLPGFLAGMAIGELAGYTVVAYTLNKRHRLPIALHDLRATLELLVPVILGVCAWKFLFPLAGLSDRVSSLVTTLVVLPVPSFFAAKKLLKAMKAKSEDA